MQSNPQIYYPNNIPQNKAINEQKNNSGKKTPKKKCKCIGRDAKIDSDLYFKIKEENDKLKKENEELNKNYYLLADEYNKLRKYNDKIEQDYIDLKKENEEMKNNMPTNTNDEVLDKLKSDNEKLADGYTALEKENERLQDEVDKNKDLKKLVKELTMDRLKQAKNYKTEGISLDYLRPRDFEDDDFYERENQYKKPKKYYKDNKDDIERQEDNEKAALALFKIKQKQEKKRLSED